MADGLLLVQKPPGMTSHDVVEVVRRTLGTRRVGHTGTLDPMAEGLLILLVGTATKHQHAFQGHEKTYEAILQLGLQTDTGDRDGKPLRTASVPALSRSQVAEVLAGFQGPLAQTPPVYSAVKVRGRPSYWWARRHQPVALAPRMIHLFELILVDYQAEVMTFRVRCSSGTYIRTLGESVAERLGTVGCLTRLVRLRVGEWALEQAKPFAWVQGATAEMLAHEVKPCVS